MQIPDLSRSADTTESALLRAVRLSLVKTTGVVWDLELQWALEPEEAAAASLPDLLKPLRTLMLLALEVGDKPLTTKVGVNVEGRASIYTMEAGKRSLWMADAKVTVRHAVLRASSKVASVTWVVRVAAKLGGGVEEALGSDVQLTFTPGQGELPLAGRAATTLPPEAGDPDPDQVSEDGEVVQMTPRPRRRKASEATP